MKSYNYIVFLFPLTLTGTCILFLVYLYTWTCDCLINSVIYWYLTVKCYTGIVMDWTSTGMFF